MTEPGDAAGAPKLVTVSGRQEEFVSWTSDVLVYLLVLNLFVEYSDGIVIDSFTISVFTAIVLRALLVWIIRFEHLVSDFWKRWEGAVFRVLGMTSAFLILFLSKFLILEVINFIFGDHVEIHGFIPIVALILGMMGARRLLVWVYQRLGEPTEKSE